MTVNKSLDALGLDLKVIAAKNTDLLKIIESHSSEEAISGYTYSLQYNLPSVHNVANVTDGATPPWSFGIKKQTDPIARRLKKWRYSGKPFEKPIDIFNDNIDYTLHTYDDVTRLNKELLKVGCKISDHLYDSPKNQDVLQSFISNMHYLHGAVKELFELTNNLHDPISHNIDLTNALEEMVVCFSKIQKVLPSASFTLKAYHSIGQQDECTEKKMTSIDNPGKFRNKESFVGHAGAVRSLVAFKHNETQCLASG
eukprot:7550833-Ditylum_brightwellii.AAC.1